MQRYLCGGSGGLEDTAEQCSCECDQKKGRTRCKRQVFLAPTTLAPCSGRSCEPHYRGAVRVGPEAPETAGREKTLDGGVTSGPTVGSCSACRPDGLEAR